MTAGSRQGPAGRRAGQPRRGRGGHPDGEPGEGAVAGAGGGKAAPPAAGVQALEGGEVAGAGGRRLAALVLAGVAVVVFFSSARAGARAPWSYDEYFHLGMAREMRVHFPVRQFPWTPFSLMSDEFADGVPLFHAALVPLAGLPIEAAGLVAVIVGQVFVVVCLGVALWRLRVRQAWVYLLAMTTLGSLVAMRLDMCRPQLLLIGFSLLCMGLLVTEARGWVLGIVCAVFALSHAGAWIAMFYAAAWGAAAWLTPAGAARGRREAPPPDAGRARRFLWRPLAWVAAGWLAGQFLHPNFPHNLRLMAMVNLEVPFEASPAGNAALRSQIGEELSPPGLAVLGEEWVIFVVPLVAALALLREKRLRTRATLAAALVALSFLVLGALAMRRMLEVGAPLALLALAVLAAERQKQGLGPLLGSWTAMTAGAALLIGALWTATTLRSHGFGEVSQPQEMARWLGEHGRAGEQVFTAQWADAAPLFYSAPQLRSLVALDPTMFFAKDPRLFQEYVDIVQGRRAAPAEVIRERFHARWVTIWKAPVYQQFAQRLVQDRAVRLVYKDPYYLVADLGGR
jgi:hypothetical protein